MNSSNSFAARFRKHSDIALAFVVVGVVGMMIVPLPTGLLDILLATNIAFAVTLLMVSLYIPNAIKLASFPSILLLTTLFRLALNVSSTRLILLQADAGSVIDAFGNFVVQGNYVVGAVIFLILTIIQFLVIAKGSERVSEVAARFTLDAMPGRQMAIDADLRAGAFDLEEARRKRSMLQQESQLYGAMDGAMKFVKGDAIAGMIITGINIVAGMVVGVLQLDMAPAEAASVYTLLTIGDGLVSQIPALLIAMTAGIIVTRVASDDSGHLGGDIVGQVIAHPKALAITGGLLVLLGIIPGLPTIPFVSMGVILGFVAYRLLQPDVVEEPELEVVKAEVSSSERQAKTMVPMVTPITLELGQGSMLPPERAQWLQGALGAMREGVFLELGVKVPAVRIRTDARGVGANKGRISIDELPVSSFEFEAGKRFVAAAPDAIEAFAVGELTTHPVNRKPASWVDERHAESLDSAGFRTWDFAGYSLIHLTAGIKANAQKFVGVQDVQNLLNQLETRFPAVVQEVVPKVISVVDLTEVLRRLVAEGVSIRNMKAILGVIASNPEYRDAVELTERVREGLSAYLTHRLTEPGSVAYVLDREIEDMVAGSIRVTESGNFLSMPPSVSSEIMMAVKSNVTEDLRAGRLPVVLTDQSVRRYVKRLVELEMPDVAVMAYQELEPTAVVQPMGTIKVGSQPIA